MIISPLTTKLFDIQLYSTLQKLTWLSFIITLLKIVLSFWLFPNVHFFHFIAIKWLNLTDKLEKFPFSRFLYWAFSGLIKFLSSFSLWIEKNKKKIFLVVVVAKGGWLALAPEHWQYHPPMVSVYGDDEKIVEWARRERK